jgi:hypothetical protein
MSSTGEKTPMSADAVVGLGSCPFSSMTAFATLYVLIIAQGSR